jgi:uncharacterized protein involved in exopolysaccharide biosynthesis
MKKGNRTTREEAERVFGIVRRCLAFWKRALLVFVVTGAIAGPYSITRPRSYKSETVVLYQESIRSSDITGGEGGSSETARRVGARLKEALLSRASLEPIITELNLYPTMVERRGLVDAVDEMRKHITFRAREGDTFEIAFEGGSPDEVQEVTKRLADTIVKEAASRRAEQAKVVKEFVGAESDRNKGELRGKEAELAAFLALHPEFKRLPGTDAPAPGAAPSAPATTSSDDPTLSALEGRAWRIDSQLRSAGKAPPPKPVEPPKPVVDSPEVVAAKRDLADKLAKYTDKHPDVQAARARLRAAEAAQAAAQAATAAATPIEPVPPPQDTKTLTEEEKEALRKELATLTAQIAARRAAIRGTSAAAGADAATPASVALEVEFRRLSREVEELRERQRQLDEKLFKASITASSVMNDRNITVSVLDPAYRPTHAISKPRSTLLAVALAICLALALATMVISARLDDRLRDRSDLEHLDLLPVLGVIPRATSTALRKES